MGLGILKNVLKAFQASASCFYTQLKSTALENLDIPKKYAGVFWLVRGLE